MIDHTPENIVISRLGLLATAYTARLRDAVEKGDREAIDRIEIALHKINEAVVTIGEMDIFEAKLNESELCSK